MSSLGLNLQLKMSQQLVMTPQLQQAIKLLQLNHIELASEIQKQLEENPMLEDIADADLTSGEGVDTSIASGLDVAGVNEGEQANAEYSLATSDTHAQQADQELAQDMASISDLPIDATPTPTKQEVEKEIDWEVYSDNYSAALPATTGASRGGEEMPAFDATLSTPETLHDNLRWQVQMANWGEDTQRIALFLIEDIDDAGYLSRDAVLNAAAGLKLEPGLVEQVVFDLQQLEPLGVAARDLRECLLIQCRQRFADDKLVYDLIDGHLSAIERRRYKEIAKALGVPLPQVGELISRIALLNPKPGRCFNPSVPHYITPDIYLSKAGGEWVITLNEEGLPKLHISPLYKNPAGLKEENGKAYIQEKLRGASWLIRSIHMRQRTIYRVMESILRFQSEFFDKGVEFLKPMILREIAEDIEMHESTISRVTTNKYVHCSRGTFELKFFFNAAIGRAGQEGIASVSVRDQIKRMIDNENPKKPLSDQKIVTLLKGSNIEIARRTVAKYRDILKIPSSSKRKQVF